MTKAKTTTVYIAGPMTGYPDYNAKAFTRAADDLRDVGYEVVSPHELDSNLTEAEKATTPWEEFMARDLAEVLRADEVCVLQGWEASKGARLEVKVAQAAGKPVWAFGGDGDSVESESILEEAERLVVGARGADYGHPSEDFGRTAKMWTAILGHPVTAADVALCMVALKLSREVNRPKRDNRVDAAGYLLTLEMVRQREGDGS